jgi:hypothetical protein
MLGADAGCPGYAVLGNGCLNRVPKLFVDSGRVFAGINVALVCGLATVGAVLE